MTSEAIETGAEGAAADGGGIPGAGVRDAVFCGAKRGGQAVLAVIVVTCGKKYAFCASCIIGMMMECMLSNSNVPSLYVIAYPAITMLCAQTFADMTDRQLEQRRLAYERRQVRISQGQGRKHWWYSFMLRYRDADLPPVIRIPLCAGEMDFFLNLVLIAYMYLIGEVVTLIHVYRLAGSILYTMGLAAALMLPCRKLLGMYPRAKRVQGGEGA